MSSCLPHSKYKSPDVAFESYCGVLAYVYDQSWVGIQMQILEAAEF